MVNGNDDVTFKPDQKVTVAYQLMLEKEGKRVFDGVRDVKSAGCGKNPPSTAPSSSVVDGVTRHQMCKIYSLSKRCTSNLVSIFR